ncbi:MAG: hypothetical protein II976_07440 [Alistipes sp.]|nr:hypothetical protein [Alistipes sp.]
MLDQGFTRYSKGNMLLCVAVAAIAMLGLGLNVYKANTGEEPQWMPIVCEACTLIIALWWIYTYFRKRKEGKEE